MSILKSHTETVNISIDQLKNWIQDDLSQQDIQLTFIKRDVSSVDDRFPEYKISGIHVLAKQNTQRGIDEKEYEFTIEEINKLVEMNALSWFTRPIKTSEIFYVLEDVSSYSSPIYEVKNIKLKVYY